MMYDEYYTIDYGVLIIVNSIVAISFAIREILLDKQKNKEDHEESNRIKESMDFL